MERTSADSSRREVDEECNVQASSSQAASATPTQVTATAQEKNQKERSQGN